MSYENKDQVLSMFAPSFLTSHGTTPIVENVINRLMNGESEYSVIEMLVNIHLRDTEILKEYYHPKPGPQIKL